jgi:NADH:ubiquinone oxidoreductase subunit E
MKSNMEELIHHFKLFTEGIHVPEGEAMRRSSTPRASSASTCVSDGANKPYRLKIRAPGFAHLAAMDEMARGHMIADAVAIIGTMDIVFGEMTDDASPTPAGIDREVAKYPADQKQSAVMAGLPSPRTSRAGCRRSRSKAVAAYLGMPPIAAYEVATFYNMYDLKPVGRTSSTSAPTCPASCAVATRPRAPEASWASAINGETTPDGLHAQEGECMGACGDAPVMLVNNRRCAAG